MKLICITDRYGNFTKGKIYSSYAEMVNCFKEVVAFKILDDDCDGYYINLPLDDRTSRIFEIYTEV